MRASTFDESWFRGLYEDHYLDLIGYATRRVRSREDAKDLVSEVFAVAWRRRAIAPDGTTAQRMWLYGIARRVLSNDRRREARRLRLGDRLASVHVAMVADPAADDDPSDVETAFRALVSLRPADRDILLLSLWEALTVGQIAIVMEISPANVSVRLHRAKARLRREFHRRVKDHPVGGHVIERRAHGDVAPETST